MNKCHHGIQIQESDISITNRKSLQENQSLYVERLSPH